MYFGIGGLAGESDQRDDDGDEDSFQGAKHEHSEKGGRGPAKFHRADRADRAEFSRLDQPHRIDDDHGGQHGMRQVLHDGRQEKHGGDRDARGDQRRFLRPSTRSPDHARLRSPATRGHGAKEGAAQIARAGGDQFAIGVEHGFAGARKGAPNRDRLGKTHQRNADCPWQQLLHQGQVRQRKRREPLRDKADDRHALSFKAKQPGSGNAAADRNQRGGGMRPLPLHADQ